MRKKKIKEIKRMDIPAMELHLNGLYRMKVIPNKKKEQNNRKKFNLKKEMSSYLITFNNRGNSYIDILFPKVIKQLFIGD